MKSLVKSPKTTLTRLDGIENARRLIKCVMNSNPLTPEEIIHFNQVMKCLSMEAKLHMRPDTKYTPDDWEATLI